MSIQGQRSNVNEKLKAPNALLLMMEGRAPWEYAAMLAATSGAACAASAGTGPVTVTSPNGQAAIRIAPDGGSYVVTSGFWAAAPTHGLDDIFFNGFEECGP